MIDLRRRQRSFGDGLIDEQVEELWEDWMRAAEVVLRMLLLKHIRHWSFAVLVREVRANLVYRQFTRVGAAKVPDDKTLGRLA